MNTHKARLWTKLILIVLLSLYLLFFVWLNAGNRTDVWLFFGWQIHQVSVVLVIVVTILLTLLIAWFGRQIYRTLRQLGGRR